MLWSSFDFGVLFGDIFFLFFFSFFAFFLFFRLLTRCSTFVGVCCVFLGGVVVFVAFATTVSFSGGAFGGADALWEGIASATAFCTMAGMAFARKLFKNSRRTPTLSVIVVVGCADASFCASIFLYFIGLFLFLTQWVNFVFKIFKNKLTQWVNFVLKCFQK